MEVKLNIGELAKRTGLTRSRIRFYEAAGLLSGIERHKNGYRIYSSEVLVTLELVTIAQKAGFSLDEIRTLLPSQQENGQHEILKETLRHKIADITALETRLAHSKAQLVALLSDIETRPEDMDCATNRQRVLSRIRDRKEEPGLETQDVKRLSENRRL